MELAYTAESIKDIDEKELAEALPRLHEEVATAEEALRAAQQRLHAANHRLAKIPTFVEVYDDHLAVDVKGRDKVLKLLGRLRIPLEHVVGAEADANVEWAVWRGWRVPGVRVPGVRFYDMHGHRDKTIVIWLKDEAYDRLITEVQDSAEVVEKINAAVGAQSRSEKPKSRLEATADPWRRDDARDKS